MKQNLGRIDSRLRSIVAWILVLLMTLKLINGVWALMATFTVIVLLFIVFMQYFPLHKILSLSAIQAKK